MITKSEFPEKSGSFQKTENIGVLERFLPVLSIDRCWSSQLSGSQEKTKDS